MRKISELPARPQRTNQAIGQNVKLFTNHFTITLPKELDTVHIYSIQILNQANEELDSNDSRRIKRILSHTDFKVDFKVYYVAGLNLWTDSQSKDRAVYDTKLNEETYKVIIKHVLSSPIQDLLSKDRNQLQMRQFQNAVVKNHLNRQGYSAVDSKNQYFKPKDKYKVEGYNLDVMQGFKVSTDFCNNQLQLIIDFSCRVIRKETALDVIQACKNQDQIKMELTNISVLAHYSTSIYRIQDIDFKLTPMSKFDCQQYGQISYMDYFKKRYNIAIKNTTQPLLVHKKKGRTIYLIPELMLLTGLKDKEKASGKLMVELAKLTKMQPRDRQQRIFKLARELRADYGKENYDLNPVKDVTGATLNPPQIMTSRNVQLDNKNNYILKDPVLKGVTVQSWAILYCSQSQNDDDDIDNLLAQIQSQAKKIGIKFAQPEFIVVQSTNPLAWQKVIESEKQKFQLILTVTYDKNAQVYQVVKKQLLNMKGIASQHLLLSKLFNSKNPNSIIQKLLIQINAKLGGPIVQVEIPKFISPKTMLVGVDVYHKTLMNRKSCAGFVASLDSNFTQYYSNTIMQQKGQELTYAIGDQFKIALQEYKKQNNYLPDTIVVYRDGVGEGQYEDIMEYEVAEIKKCMTKDMTIAFILVNKRINNRFFSGKSFEDCENASSGTLVSDKITKKGFNFYLIAQCVAPGQGTATPTHYTCIENTTKIPEEAFWQLTYFQCYNYANWGGPVRVPSVCQYAHKLAYLVGETFQDKLHQSLTRGLHYL